MSANLMSLARSGGKFLKLFGDRKMMKTMPTARDYVQDGLVAMWDGIENAGWGVHDHAATSWKDLVGTNDLTLSKSPVSENIGWWTDKSYFSPYKVARTVGNCFIRRGVISQDFVNCVNSANLTAEVCFKTLVSYSHNPGLFRAYESSYTQLVLLIWDKDFSFRGEGWYPAEAARGRLDWERGKFTSCSYRAYGIDSYADGFNSSTGKMQVKIATTSSSSPSMTTGGTIVLNSQSRTDYDSLQGEMYCVRLYNRALTDQEIAHNYAIDKARFNLPD